MKSPLLLLTAFIFTGFLAACSLRQNESPEGYNLNRPTHITSPIGFNNISVFAFHNGNSGLLYFISDTSGVLHCYFTGNKSLVNTRFGGGDAYTGLAIWRDKVVVLSQNGHLRTFPLSQVGRPVVDSSSIKNWTKVLPEGDYRGLYIDSATGRICVICSECKNDSRQKKGYSLVINQQGVIRYQGRFGLQLKEIEKKSGLDLSDFTVSGLARNTRTGEWYISSDEQKLLVVTNRNWHVKDAFKLDTKIFTRPGSVSFDSSYNCYILNRNKNRTASQIMEFTYR